ncbi:alpha-2,8-sialyltransferase 8B-like [Amphiura filiformis]|uniref:alpha-2,8-sialyltransferase 8B-like n=1 Tax=Amphiura filiformis TaxID=82378 RepID=UPI003B210384
MFRGLNRILFATFVLILIAFMIIRSLRSNGIPVDGAGNLIYQRFDVRNRLLNISKSENRIQIFKPDIPVEAYNFNLGWIQSNSNGKPNLKSATLRKVYKSPQTFGMEYVHHKTCAIVGNSGILLHSACGKEIDNHEFVFRANMAPIKKFISDVGKHTDIMTINYQVMNYMIGNFTSATHDAIRWRKEYEARLKFLDSSILWYFKSAAHLDSVHKLASIVRTELALPLRFAFSPHGMGNPTKRIWNVTIPTSGLILYTFATAMCNQITLYGFYPFSEDESHRQIYNHYYENEVIDFQTDTIHEYVKEYRLLEVLNKIGAIRLVTTPCR